MPENGQHLSHGSERTSEAAPLEPYVGPPSMGGAGQERGGAAKDLGTKAPWQPQWPREGWQSRLLQGGHEEESLPTRNETFPSLQGVPLPLSSILPAVEGCLGGQVTLSPVCFTSVLLRVADLPAGVERVAVLSLRAREKRRNPNQ